MSENVRKLVGVAAMAALVVVGLVTTSGGDDDVDFTRNFGGCRYESPYCRAELARLAPAFLKQAAPKSLDTGPINKINKEGGPIFKGAKDSISLSIPANSLSTGKASVLEGKGVDGKGGTSRLIIDSTQVGVVSGQDIEAIGGVSSLKGNYEALIEDRIQKWNDCSAPDNLTVNSLKNVLVGSYMENTKDLHSWGCAGDVTWAIKESEQLNQKSEQLSSFDQKTNQLKAQGEGMLHDTAMAIRVGKDEAGLLAECMESKVGGVLLKSHTEAMAADCVATVMPALLPDRAKRLGTYWQTPEQLTGLLPALASETNED